MSDLHPSLCCYCTHSPKNGIYLFVWNSEGRHIKRRKKSWHIPLNIKQETLNSYDILTLWRMSYELIFFIFLIKTKNKTINSKTGFMPATGLNSGKKTKKERKSAENKLRCLTAWEKELLCSLLNISRCVCVARWQQNNWLTHQQAMSRCWHIKPFTIPVISA